MEKSAFKGKVFYGGQKNTAKKSFKIPKKPSAGLFGLFSAKVEEKELKGKLPKPKEKDQQKETGFKYKISDGQAKTTFFEAEDRQKISSLSQKMENKTPGNVKVFGPDPAKLRKERIKSGLESKLKKPKRGKYGLKTLEQIRQGATRLGFERGWMWLKSWALSVNLGGRFNRLIASCLIVGSFIFITYLTFFDTYFLVKNYEVRFSQNSFIDENELEVVMESVRQNMFLGVVPNNQFWFLNDQNLTSAAQQANSEISSIKLLDRKWPDEAIIEITTEPILLTLGLNDGEEYWRISQSGEVIGRDEANLRENLVIVESPVTLTYSSGQLRGGAEASFAEYSFEQRTHQKNRFWFIIWLWEGLKELEVEHVKTSIPSLSDFDNDVTITTSNNTELLFDLTAGDRENLRRRLDLVFSSSVADREAAGKIDYIDFRTPKRVFVCPRGGKCG